MGGKDTIPGLISVQQQIWHTLDTRHAGHINRQLGPWVPIRRASSIITFPLGPLRHKQYNLAQVPLWQ